MTASLAYRKNEPAILRGDVPEKYTRLLPFITGDHILEIGSAEGVLALMLARAGKSVTALEARADRHESALRLDQQWSQHYRYASPAFVNGSIGDRLDLLEGVDTLVAVRVIYYLRAALDPVFEAVARQARQVVLCGNRNRAARHFAGTSDGKAEDYYASAEGMRGLLQRHGYRIEAEERDGDPVVVGRRDG